MALTKIPGSGVNANSITLAVLTEIQSSFNAVTSTLTVPNLSANSVTVSNIKTDNILYANGSAYAFTSSAAGSNTQVQFNNASSFAGSADLTFDTTTNTLTATNFVGNGSGLSAIAGANVTGTVANATYAITSGTAYAVAGANVTGQVGNALVTATVYTNAQPNITSVGTLTELTVTGNISANFYVGNGSLLTGLVATGSNFANYAGNVTVAAQPNITSVGTLTSLAVTGNVVAGNISTSGSGGNITGANVITATTMNASANITAAFFIGNGSQLTGLPASYSNSNVAAYLPTYTGNITATTFIGNLTGLASSATVAASANAVTGANVSGAVSFATTANAVAGANVSGTVANATYSVTAGTVTTAAQPNITSTGTLTALTVTGNVVAGNISTSGSGGNITGANVITANTFTASANITAAFFIGNGSQLTGIAAGTSTTAVTVTASAQSNITSVGTLTSLATSGDITVGGNLTVNGTTTTINATTLSVTDLNITVAKDAATASAANGAGITVAGAAATILYTSSSDTWNFNKTIVGNLTGIASSATIAASAYAVAGANVTGAVSLATYATTANAVAGANVSGTVGLATFATTANAVAGANVTGTVANATYAITSATSYAVDGANVTGAVGLATFATTANAVAGANVSGTVANATYALTAGSSTTAETVTTAAQPNITSVGTLTDLAVGNSYGTVTTTQYSSIFAKANGLNATSLIQVKGNDGTNGMGMRAVTGSAALIYSNAAIDFRVGSTIRDLDTPSGGTTIVSIASTGLTVTGVVSANGNVTGGNLITDGNITSVNANLGNAVTANYFIGNGSLLTGIASGSNYTDSNVAAYLPTYTGNLTAGNANLGNNVSANYFTGSGAFLTSITAITASSVTGNAQANITSLGTLTTLTVGNATANTVLGNGTITSSGDISFTGANVSLGDVGNVKIAGGEAGYFITTDGTGNLSWGAAAGGGGVSATGSNTQIQFNDGGVLGASANLVFNKTTNTFTTGRIVTLTGANLGSNISNVYIGGGNDNQILKTDGAGNLSWIAQPVATIAVDNFTGDGTTTSFTLSVTPGSINQTVVNYNGAFQLREAYTLTGSTLTFSEAPISGSKIEVTSTLGAMTGAGSFVTRNYTGNGIQSTFSVTDGCTVSSVLVTENGLLQTPTVDYTISGSTLTFNGAPETGIVIQIRELAIAIVTAAGVNITSISYPSGSSATTAGGQTITITGSGFYGGVIVYVDTTPCTTTYVSSTSLTFTSPAKTANSYHVFVYNTNGSTGIKPAGIIYA